MEAMNDVLNNWTYQIQREGGYPHCMRSQRSSNLQQQAGVGQLERSAVSDSKLDLTPRRRQLGKNIMTPHYEFNLHSKEPRALELPTKKELKRRRSVTFLITFSQLQRACVRSRRDHSPPPPPPPPPQSLQAPPFAPLMLLLIPLTNAAAAATLCAAIVHSPPPLPPLPPPPPPPPLKLLPQQLLRSRAESAP